jgi:hypothetical protein
MNLLENSHAHPLSNLRLLVILGVAGILFGGLLWLSFELGQARGVSQGILMVRRADSLVIREQAEATASV